MAILSMLLPWQLLIIFCIFFIFSGHDRILSSVFSSAAFLSLKLYNSGAKPFYVSCIYFSASEPFVICFIVAFVESTTHCLHLCFLFFIHKLKTIHFTRDMVHKIFNKCSWVLGICFPCLFTNDLCALSSQMNLYFIILSCHNVLFLKRSWSAHMILI